MLLLSVIFSLHISHVDQCSVQCSAEYPTKGQKDLTFHSGFQLFHTHLGGGDKLVKHYKSGVFQRLRTIMLYINTAIRITNSAILVIIYE